MQDVLKKINLFQTKLLQNRGKKDPKRPRNKRIVKTIPNSSVNIEKPNPMLRNVRVEYIEKICEQIPPRNKLTMSTLQQYLKAYADQTKLNEVERAYLVYYWVAHNIDYDFKNWLKGRETKSSPDDVLKSGQSVCGGYSNLFQSLITPLGIQCVNIDCFAKGFGIQVGESIPDKTNHQHNAIQLNGAWYLVDSTWGAGSVVNNTYKKDFNNYNFCCDPKEFALTHFPTDPQWQLLEEPITKEAFSVFPFLDKRFFQLGFKSMNPFACAVTTEQILDVVFYYDPDLDEGLKMNATLFLNKKEVKNCVLIQKYEDYFQVRILLNDKGVYNAHFFAFNGEGEENKFMQITEMKITCNKKQDKPIYFPKIQNCYGELVLETPFCNNIPKGANVAFKLYSLDINEITIVNGDDWIDVQKGSDNYFKKDVVIKSKEIKICEKTSTKYFPKYIFDCK